MENIHRFRMHHKFEFCERWFTIFTLSNRCDLGKISHVLWCVCVHVRKLMVSCQIRRGELFCKKKCKRWIWFWYKDSQRAYALICWLIVLPIWYAQCSMWIGFFFGYTRTTTQRWLDCTTLIWSNCEKNRHSRKAKYIY